MRELIYLGPSLPTDDEDRQFIAVEPADIESMAITTKVGVSWVSSDLLQKEFRQ